MKEHWQAPEHEEDPYERGFAHKLYESDDAEAFHEAYGEDGLYEEWEEAPPKKRASRKKRILSFFVILILLPSLLIGALLFFSKAPMGSEIGHLEGVSTILLAGTDESGDRTDTIMLLNIDRGAGQISLMSIPRDTRVASTYWPQKINAAYGMNGCGEEGMEALMDYVSDCVGFRPDAYLLLELDVFIQLVDLFGGVEFDVPVDMYYEDPSQGLSIDLEKGLQRLDGESAMGLVRYRYGYADADIGRISVQRDFLLAAMDQWASLKNIGKVPKAIDLFLEHSVTDLSMGNLIWLARMILKCGTENMQMFTMPYYFSGEYVIVNVSQDYLDCINRYFNPYTKPVTTEDLNIAYG